MRRIPFLILFFSITFIYPQDSKMYKIIEDVSAERIESDITNLVSFGTRHTLSDTISKTRGIGAARRWIKKEFEKISNECNQCLEVFYEKSYVTREDSERVIFPTWVYNVVAIQRGEKNPNRYIIMSGDIDSRVSDPTNYIDDSPGANDNASGMAGTIEAARVLSKYKFDNSILYWAFFILWSMYGVLYMMDEKTKNVGFNIIDLCAKCFVGIFFWAYFPKVITL